jgi:hypothetical protein
LVGRIPDFVVGDLDGVLVLISFVLAAVDSAEVSSAQHAHHCVFLLQPRLAGLAMLLLELHELLLQKLVVELVHHWVLLHVDHPG